MSVDTLNLNPVEQEASLPDDIQAMVDLGRRIDDLKHHYRMGEIDDEGAMVDLADIFVDTVDRVVAHGRYSKEKAEDDIQNYLEAILADPEQAND